MVRGSGGCVGWRRTLLLVLALALALLFTSCRRVERPAVSQAFYYWRTTFDLTAAEQRALSDLAVDKLAELMLAQDAKFPNLARRGRAAAQRANSRWEP